MSTEWLRSTALTFPTHMSARDGWHPRLFAKLSEPALAALSDLFWAIEFYGDFPLCIREVLIRLIPKPASQDTRPIGLYTGFFRLWARARAQTIRDWTTTVPEYAEIVNMLPGRCTTDAVWRAQVMGMVADVEELHAAELLWDIRKCYENVLHAELQEQAREQGYPMALLRVSLVTSKIFPKAGIVAGSSMATFEIAVLMQKLLRGQMPILGIKMSLHIDDLSLSIARNTTTALIADLATAAAAITHVLETRLHLPIAADKSQVLGSSEAVDKALVAHFGNQLGPVVTTARRLGVDHSLRRVKQNPVFRKRFKLFSERRGLIKNLGKAGRFGQINMFSAGMLPSLLFGCECNTPPLKVLTQCRIGLVQVRGLGLPGVAHQLALLALPPQCDPMEQVLEAALYRWHREVWLHTKQHPSHADRLTLHHLQTALSAGQEMAKGLEWECRGPVFAVIRATRAVGWELISAVSIRTEDGQLWSLRDGEPGDAQAFVQEKVGGHPSHASSRAPL